MTFWRQIGDFPAVKPDWNVWRLDPSNYTLVAGTWHNYYVDLERCTTSAETLDWIFQVQHKEWATPQLLAGLLSALNDVLKPQATLCSMGTSKRLSKRAIRARVNTFAEQHPDLVVNEGR